jgi:hypothetical protein
VCSLRVCVLARPCVSFCMCVYVCACVRASVCRHMSTGLRFRDSLVPEEVPGTTTKACAIVVAKSCSLTCRLKAPRYNESPAVTTRYTGVRTALCRGHELATCVYGVGGGGGGGGGGNGGHPAVPTAPEGHQAHQPHASGVGVLSSLTPDLPLAPPPRPVPLCLYVCMCLCGTRSHSRAGGCADLW